MLATTLVWAMHYDRWTPEDWQIPTGYSGDAHEILARIKAASEGETLPLTSQVIDRLGAPFGANWNGYPTPDKILILFLGGLAQLIGLFASANAGLLLAQVSAALAFYFTARWLRVRWEWAWTGAILFAYTYHTFHRGLAHFSFVFTWTVPLGLLAVWLVAQSRRLEWRSPGAVVCLSVAIALGLSNPYNLLFWGQLLVWALVMQWFGARRKANLSIGVVAGVLAVLAFVGTNAEAWFFPQEPDAVPLLTRNYGGTERYALKPIEMFLPSPHHRLDELAFFGHRYRRWSDWRGEDYIPYLGLVGIVGLLWLGAAVAKGVLTRRAVPKQALTLGWLLAYATVGGLTNLLAFFVGFQVFRATNRVAIFISALVLIFLIVRLSRLTAHWPARWRLVAAFGVAGIGLLDQVPESRPDEVQERVAANVRSDLKLGRALDEALPRGARVFQLPVMGFPEVQAPYRLTDYEHFRPYLTTRNPDFSYGAAKYRARSRWQRDLEDVPTATLVRRLESYGFSALYLNRKGFKDRAEGLLNELAALGYDRRLQGTGGQQVVVFLNPVAQPKKPLARSLTYGRGWNPRLDDGVRWASGDAALTYYNPFDHPVVAEISLELIGVTPRPVEVVSGGRVAGRVQAGAEAATLELPPLDLAPGVNSFQLRSSEPAKRLGRERYQLRSFGLVDARIRIRMEGFDSKQVTAAMVENER